MKHEIVDELSGQIIDEVLPSPEKEYGPEFGAPEENTAKTEKEGDKLIVEWNIDDIVDDGQPKSLVVSLCLNQDGGVTHCSCLRTEGHTSRSKVQTLLGSR